MVQLIIGEKGKGKTKELLDKVNKEIQDITGNVVYLDKNTRHMFELNNKIRLIDCSEYLLDSPDAFVGFVSGIISQDHDLQKMYLDSLMKVAKVEADGVESILKKLEVVSEKFKIDFVISVSVTESDLSDEMKANVILSL
ncbi:MAG: twitching motility protein PilT [Lachnospiraceae bacterium]|nr:twitching motility protein PilT [Clostridiales bacterium]MDY3109537.1 twitching motility protein PilT [Lachnospiraceae bacterium]